MKFPIPFQIGLHVTLTGGFQPLVACPVSSGTGFFPKIADTLPPLGFFRIQSENAGSEIRAQLERFIAAFGHPPDFVDGHQHVQLMPGVREPFLETVAELAPKAWVRQCGPLRREEMFRSNKAHLLAFLSRGFRQKAHARGIAFNVAFSGAYDHSTPREFSEPFARFVEGMPEGGVVMCHPGHPDEILAARDPLTGQRETEYQFLMSDEMPRALSRADVTLD
jgi:predicted glycoside hydrolase/deacetylase ChbG (UPF0249 family)